jgi:hypothetical protein
MRIVVLGGLFLAFLALSGCGAGKPVSVDGEVTLDGKPVPDAMVVFHPEKGGTQASGMTDANGVFHLTTFNTGDGALPGNYRATVQKLKAQGDAVTTNVDPANPDSMRKAIGGFIAGGQSAQRKAQNSSLPPSYGNPDSSGLKYSVPTSGTIKIALKTGGGT